MKVQAPFGFVTGCHAGDKFLVQATLASMRHYCPDVPICLTVDGNFDVSDLEKEYDLIVLRVAELPSEEMRKLLGGNYQAKLAAMWEAADATEVPPWLPHFYFDPQKLRQFDANFDWSGHAYFSAGAFACRRNAISFRRWTEVESWEKQVPGLFAWGEMGMLNYHVHSLTQRGEIKTAMSNLQHIWEHHGKQELVEDCRAAGWHFPKTIDRPRIAHFCGRKSFLFDRKAYSRPVTIARLEYHRTRHGELGAWFAVLQEDCQRLRTKVRRRVSNLVKG